MEVVTKWSLLSANIIYTGINTHNLFILAEMQLLVNLAIAGDSGESGDSGDSGESGDSGDSSESGESGYAGD